MFFTPFMNLSSFYRTASAVALSTMLASCGAGLGYSIEITSHSIAPNPVATPGNNQEAQFVVSVDIAANPEYTNASFLIGDLSAAQTEFVAPLASFNLTCASAHCSSGNVRTTCLVGMNSAPSGTQRNVRCNGTAETFVVTAGRYAYRLTANTQGGTFLGAEFATVDGVIEIR
jgi:hypothetical protein